MGDEGTNDEVWTKETFSLCLFYYYYERSNRSVEYPHLNYTQDLEKSI